MRRLLCLGIGLTLGATSSSAAQRVMPSALHAPTPAAHEAGAPGLPAFQSADEGNRSVMRRVVVGAVIGAAAGGVLRIVDGSKHTSCPPTGCNNVQRSTVFFVGGGAAVGAGLGLLYALTDVHQSHDVRAENADAEKRLRQVRREQRTP